MTEIRNVRKWPGPAKESPWADAMAVLLAMALIVFVGWVTVVSALHWMGAI